MKNKYITISLIWMASKHKKATAAHARAGRAAA
jgi:hypothetical protein